MFAELGSIESRRETQVDGDTSAARAESRRWRLIRGMRRRLCGERRRIYGGRDVRLIARVGASGH